MASQSSCELVEVSASSVDKPPVQPGQPGNGMTAYTICPLTSVWQPQNAGHPRRQVDEIQRVRGRLGGGRVRQDLLLEHVLDRAIRDRVPERRGRDDGRSDVLAMTDRLPGDAVLVQLVDQGAREDDV